MRFNNYALVSCKRVFAYIIFLLKFANTQRWIGNKNSIHMIRNMLPADAALAMAMEMALLALLASIILIHFSALQTV